MIHLRTNGQIEISRRVAVRIGPRTAPSEERNPTESVRSASISARGEREEEGPFSLILRIYMSMRGIKTIRRWGEGKAKESLREREKQREKGPQAASKLI